MSDPINTPPDGPPNPFFEELAESFRRRSPQGNLRWNFSGAFSRLEKIVQRGVVSALGNPAEGEPETPSTRSSLRVGRRGRAQDDDGRSGIVRELTEALEVVDAGLDAALEALRFLSARVERLEHAAERRRQPIDGLAWLAAPPRLEIWAEAVLRWLGADAAPGPSAGPVLVGECGDGSLPLALSGAGWHVLAAEPRASSAWEAANRGVEVHIGEVAQLVALRAPESLTAIVLAGATDRLGFDELADLVEHAGQRLIPGGSLVVVSEGTAGWSEAAHDLLPGRPLRPATWELLLRRAGYASIETVRPAELIDAYCVRGVR